MITCRKKYENLPAAHRQHNHDGHCSLIHGHDWAFTFTFTCRTLTEEGFVVDFGKLDWLKSYLRFTFDHTLLLNKDDPELDFLLKKLSSTGLAKIVIVDNCGAEGLAKMLFDEVSILLTEIDDYEKRGVVLLGVECFEDSKNSAHYGEWS